MSATIPTPPAGELVECPAGSYYYREEPDNSPGCRARWRRALQLIRELAERDRSERDEPRGKTT